MASFIPNITAAWHEEPSHEPLTAIEASFGVIGRALQTVARTQARLDDEQPAAPRFHHLLRVVEAAEERIGGTLDAVLASVPTSLADQHLRRVARDLWVARSIEDGEDAVHFVDALQAWPDLLFLSDAHPEADRVNAMIQFCLDAVIDLQKRDAPAMMALRALPHSAPANGAPSAPTLH